MEPSTNSSAFPAPKPPRQPQAAPLLAATPVEPLLPAPHTQPTPPASAVANAERAKNASWGAIISILIILGMVVMAAFYAWGQRIAENPSHQVMQ